MSIASGVQLTKFKSTKFKSQLHYLLIVYLWESYSRLSKLI